MSNLISRTLATGNSKIYYNVEKEFEAVGTLYTNSSMHYVAAHPHPWIVDMWYDTKQQSSNHRICKMEQHQKNYCR